VRAITDAGGEFTALFRPLVGRSPVARFFGQFGASRQRGDVHIAIRSINGFPTADVEVESPRGRRPPRLLLSLDVDHAGRISTVRVLANSRKLAAMACAPVALKSSHAI